MKKIICLDLDDTLIQTQESYKEINQNLVNILQKSTFIPRSSILDVQSKIDIDLIKTEGFSKERFPRSWIETFRFFLGQNFYFEDIVYSEAKKIFSNTIDLHKDAERFLKKIKNSNYIVWIVTHGNIDIQNKRIQDVGLQWVDRVVISEHKNLQLYQTLKNQTSLDLIMIGNSIRHDILPAIEAGLETIHIERQIVWKYDVSKSSNGFLSYKSLDHIKF